VGWGLSSLTLFTGKRQQLRVGSEHFAHGILKFTAGIDLLLDFREPFFGDALGAPFSIGHEHQRPRLMAFAFGTVASGLATTGVVQDQGTGKEVIGDGELAQQYKLSLTQTGGEGAFGCDFHLVYMFTQEHSKSKQFL
jgi:hypothetical protein